MRALPVPLLPRSLRYFGAVVIAGVLLYFSVLSAPPVEPPAPGPLWDKKLHFVGYGVFGLALAYSSVHLRSTPAKRITLVLGIAIGYGLLIEGIQSVQPQRYASLADALANVIGVLFANAWFVIEPRLQYVRLLSDETEATLG